MGYNPRAKTIIGLRLDYDKVFRKDVRKAFDHDYPSDWVVDPKTMRPLWTESHAPISGLKYERNDDEDKVTINGYESCFHTTFASPNSNGHKMVFIALAVFEGKGIHYYDAQFTNIQRLNDSLKGLPKFRKTFEEVGLWNDKAFGIWTWAE